MNNENQHIPVGYKSSPLGIIPEDWEVKRLGEVCDISIGRDVQINHFSDYMTNDYKYPVYSNTVEGEGLYGYYNYEEYSQGKVTVVGRGVGLGTSFARDCGFGAIGRLVVLTPKEKLSTHYLESYINNKVHFFVESAAIPQLTGEHIASYKIAIPSLSEQKKIETYIQLWDTAISKQTQLVEKLTLRKRGLMQQLLTGKKRLKGFEGEWKEVKLGEIARITMGQSPDSKYYNEIGLGLPLIQGNADIQDRKSIQRIWTSNITKTCEVDDIIMSVRAPVGEIARSTQKSCIGRGVCAIRNTGIEKEYLYQLLLSEEDSWKNIEQGGTFTAINSNEIQKKTVVIPTKNEQNSIASVLVSADKEIEIQKQKLMSLQEQKKGLMQVLLSGKKRIII